MSINKGSTRMFFGDYEFEPIPIFSWSTEVIRDAKLEDLFLRNSLDFTGVILDIPVESGSFQTLMQRRDNLKNVLTASGSNEWRITFNGNHLVSGIYPQVSNISFDEGTWADRINYTFSFTFDEQISGKSPIQDFSETWDFEENDDRRSVTASHNISAVGVNTNPSGTNNALENARTFVLSKTGYENVPPGHPAFVEGSGTLSAYEELRSENIDSQAGSFSVVESFTLSSGNFIHTRNAQFSTDNNGITTVSLDGNIRGLGRKHTAFPNALSAWNNNILPGIPGDASGVYSQFNGEAILFTSNFESISITKNDFTGTISYNVSYTDDSSQNLPSGIQDFTLNIQDEKPLRLFASFTIMERALGNVVQDIGTSTEGRFTISGSAIGKQGFPFQSLLDFVEERINQNRPLSVNYITLRLSNYSVSKDEDKNTVSFNITWTYTKDLSQVPVANDDVILE